MSIEKIERDLREALSGLTLLEMASRGMIPVSRAMVEAHEAYTKLCADRDNIRALLDELSRLRKALKPFAAAKGHFDGHVRDEDTVEIALRHIRAHHVRAAASALSEREGQE